MMTDPGANADLLARIEEDLSVLKCQHCGQPGTAVLSEAGPHIKATCGHCGKYMKFVRQKLSPEDRARWNRLKP